MRHGVSHRTPCQSMSWCSRSSVNKGNAIPIMMMTPGINSGATKVSTGAETRPSPSPTVVWVIAPSRTATAMTASTPIGSPATVASVVTGNLESVGGLYETGPMTARDVQITFDCADPAALAAFWAEALGYQTQSPPDGFDSVSYTHLTLPTKRIV